jgi:hypothetical protein
MRAAAFSQVVPIASFEQPGESAVLLGFDILPAAKLFEELFLALTNWFLGTVEAS